MLCGFEKGSAQAPSAHELTVVPPPDFLVAASVDPVSALARSDPNPSSTQPDPVSPKEPSANALLTAVKTTVEISANEQSLEEGVSVSHFVTRDQVLSAAGTFGDFSRYLQALPGVTANNDFTNEIRVRGGDPAENLFVVDGIEIPNINHFALEGSSGGFTSMVDTSEIENVEVTPGNYDAGFSTRLSALVEVRTRQHSAEAPGQVDFGISGVGGFVELPPVLKADGLLAFHRSLLNMVTNDIGINGVPIYTNGLATAEWEPSSKDRLSFLNLSGGDSIQMTPNPCDPGVSVPFKTGYGGARSTTGLTWDHFGAASSESRIGASYSFENQNIEQNWQFPINNPGAPYCSPGSFLVYQEFTRDRIGSLSYREAIQKRGWLYTFGTSARATNYAYLVAQPAGAQSPFSADPAWTDADNFNRLLTVGQYAGFGQAAGRLTNRLTLTAGVREEEFALTGAHIFEPRASLGYRLTGHQTLSIDAGHSGQLAPTINILSYAQNAKLAPIEVNQFSVGAQLWNSNKLNLSLHTYDKRYSNEPASTEYPALMLANMVDTLGQQFVWLQLASIGRGRSYGAELALSAHTASRFRTLTTITWARALYAAADGVMRPGNFDYPVVANVLASYKGFRRIEFSLRDSYTTGHPYTPFDIPASQAQSRGIYDLSKINAFRANAYDRLDIDMNRDFHAGRGVVSLYGGVENALNRHNFMGYVWLNNCQPGPQTDICGTNTLVAPGVPELRVNEMNAFPDAAIRYVF